MYEKEGRRDAEVKVKAGIKELSATGKDSLEFRVYFRKGF